MSNKIPVTVITGFLGAGKTTLIRNMLENADGRRLALIINEFGDVGVDGEVLKGCGDEACSEDDIVELANGCICCTVAEDFIPTMETLLARDERPLHLQGVEPKAEHAEQVALVEHLGVAHQERALLSTARLAQRAGHGLKGRFGDVVAVEPVQLVDVQRDAAVGRQRLKELTHQFGVKRADFRGRQFDVPDQVRTCRQVQRSTYLRVIHR